MNAVPERPPAPVVQHVAYDAVSRRLHAAVIVLLLVMFTLGWVLQGIPRSTPDRAIWVNLHKSLGLVTGVLMLARLAWRWRREPLPWPPEMPAWQSRAAARVHDLLYLLAIALPALGYAASNFSRYGVKFFLLVNLPPWGPNDPQIYAWLNAAHRLIAWTLLAVAALHAAAALWHRFRRDGLWERMWPARG